MITGVCPVLSVPFNENGQVDYESFSHLVEWIVSLDVKNVLMFGIASENIKLNDDERIKLLKTLISARGSSGLQVIASVADHSSDLAVIRAQSYEAIGADYINILPPTYFAPSVDQVLFHISEILESVKVPVIVQHLPQAGGLEDPSQIVALSKRYKNLVMIKCEAVPPDLTIEKVKELSQDRIKTLVGWGGLSWEAGVRLGAVGVQPGCSLTDLYLWAELALNEGDTLEFQRRLNLFLPTIEKWLKNIELLIAAEKRILMERKIITTDYCRNPTVHISTENYDEISRMLRLLDQEGVQ
jgi:dihydrodipicolinate synthase/N-acetylneuraminate lyase